MATVGTVLSVLTAAAIFAKATVVLPTTTSTPVTKVVPAPVAITMLVIPVPVNDVFNIPVTDPCVTVTPAVSVMSCAAIVNDHRLTLKALQPTCDTVIKGKLVLFDLKTIRHRTNDKSIKLSLPPPNPKKKKKKIKR